MTPTRPADHVLACPAAPSAPVSFGEAFRFWLKLGFIRFGGPAGQIAILHSEPVEGRRWISEQRLLHALNCCMLLPSPEAEQRGCLLIAFGGPGEIVERERVHSAGGLAVLLGLIGQGFDGGTGLQTLIERAIERVQPERWASADLLIVSDGEFGCSTATLAQLDAVRERQGLRVQGVLVGDRETMGLMEVADSIFWVRDWRRHGPGAQRAGGFSPVHSKSLTALYFPNALSGRAARHRPP